MPNQYVFNSGLGRFLYLSPRALFLLISLALLSAVGTASIAYTAMLDTTDEFKTIDEPGSFSELVAEDGDSRHEVRVHLAQNTGASTTVVSEESGVIAVVNAASPAVVSVVASGDVPRLRRCSTTTAPGLDEFFSGEILCQEGTEVRRIGAATGFIVSADGYIMTNKHVVENEQAQYSVFLNDASRAGTRAEARVVARDPNNDIAVLKIDADNLPHLSFGDSSHLQVGQTAIAIGYALGEFNNTVTRGVISGLARNIDAVGSAAGPETLRGLIQTDAAINFGNSGGPLLDIQGAVIGMNVAVADAQGIGFAIPSNVIKNAYDQARSTGKISKQEQAFLGVRFQSVTPELYVTKSLSYDYGAMVVEGRGEARAVVAGSPAQKAGIRAGDIILEVNSKKLTEQFTLSDAISAFKPGDEITLLVARGRETENKKVTLAQFPQAP